MIGSLYATVYKANKPKQEMVMHEEELPEIELFTRHVFDILSKPFRFSLHGKEFGGIVTGFERSFNCTEDPNGEIRIYVTCPNFVQHKGKLRPVGHIRIMRHSDRTKRVVICIDGQGWLVDVEHFEIR